MNLSILWQKLTSGAWLELKVFAFISGVMVSLMAAMEVVPFGNYTFAAADAMIQYLDFFAYLQKVLLQGLSVTFSFDKGLGGNMWAVMTYYLFSPLNFLVVFFTTENLQLFYNLLVVIKLSLCGLTMAYYLRKRFEGRLEASAVFVLSVGFGLMNYNLLQAKNLMWLDGVYMLPLMLLGLYRLRSEGKWTLLVLASAGSILFNWYMGLVDAVFVGLFSLAEYFIAEEKFSVKGFMGFELKTAFALGLALGINGWQFLPTLEALSVGRGSIDWQNINLRMANNPLSAVQGLGWGAVEKARQGTFFIGDLENLNRLLHPVERIYRQASFFAGDLATFGVAAFFLQKNISRRVMMVGAVLVCFVFLMFYWQPLFFLFSLLKEASSYWYRYAHLASFILIFLASIFLLKYRENREWRGGGGIRCILALAVFPLLFIGMQYYRPVYDWDTLIGPIAIYLLMAGYFGWQGKLSPVGAGWYKKVVVTAALAGIVINAVMMLTTGAYILSEDAMLRQSYARNAEKRTDDFKAILDSEVYRTSQARFYSPGCNGFYITANYNEGLAYDYHSLAAYTSSPVNAQLYLYDHLGYKKNGDNFNIMNASVLPADALLGANYVFADIAVEGLQPLFEVSVSDDPSLVENNMVYRNPFALPIAFVCQEIDLSRIEYRDNPFEYTNEVYSTLFDDQLDVYRKIPCRFASESDDEIACVIDGLPAAGAIYGNLTKDAKLNKVIVNGKEMYLQSVWCGNSVFYVPRSSKGDLTELQFKFGSGDRQSAQPYFYLVDEKELKQAHDKAADRAAEFEKFSDHEVIFSVQAKAGEQLFTSIPYDKGWQVKLNGQVVEPVKICDALIGLQLEEGENRVEMVYCLPGLKKGILVTAGSLLLLLLLCRKVGRRYV